MQTLFGAVSRHENSGRTALYFENKRISFKKMILNIRRAVSYLAECKIGAGEVVTMALPNIPQTVYLFYALDAVGAKINIIHPLSTPAGIREAMERVGSRHAILLETAWTEQESELAALGCTLHFVCPVYERGAIWRRAFYLKYKRAAGKGVRSADELYKMKPAKAIAERDAREDSVYLHSGGTTGTPKIISLSDRAVNALSEKADSILGCKCEGKSMLCVLPTFHGFGLGMGVHSPLANGAASALMMKFDAKKVIRWINQGKIDMIIGVPLLYKKLMQHKDFERAKLSNLTHCFIGGDNVQSAQIEQFNEIMARHGSSCRLLEGYGLTETVTVCTVNTKENEKTGSVGRALEGNLIEIRNDSLSKLGTGETGEVFVSTDTQMNGYFGDGAATEKTLLTLDGRSWVRTGDLGYIDGDGFLYLRGRLKRVFKISGINVYPSEIEKACCTHEAVHEAALEYFDTPTPHTTLFLIKHRDAQKSDGEIKKELTKMLSARFLKYELPSNIVFTDEFPRTKVGKVDHNAFVDVQ